MPIKTDESSNSAGMLKIMVEMTRQILIGTEAWLVEGGKDAYKLLMTNLTGCAPAALPERLLAARFEKDPSSLVVFEDSSHGVCLETLCVSDRGGPFYLVLAKLPARMELGDQEKGLLDDMRCAFDAACLVLPKTTKPVKPPVPVDYPVYGASCRRLHSGNQAWTHCHHSSDRQAFLKTVPQTICEACAIKLYGLALAYEGKKSQNESPTRYHSHDN